MPHYAGNGCVYPPEEVILSNGSAIGLENTVLADGFGGSFVGLNETVRIKCRDGMLMNPDSNDTGRDLKCGAHNTWTTDGWFECVSGKLGLEPVYPVFCVLYRVARQVGP